MFGGAAASNGAAPASRAAPNRKEASEKAMQIILMARFKLYFYNFLVELKKMDSIFAYRVTS